VATRLRAFVRGFGRSWLREGVKWYSITEGLARLCVEGAFVVALFGAGFALLPVVGAWLVLHTALWFFAYGGHAKLRTWAKLPSPVSRLETELGRYLAWAGRQQSFGTMVLRGSGERGDMDEYSDIDLVATAGGSVLRSVVALWGLRAGSTLRGVPVEAHLIDDARLVPFLSKGRPWRIVTAAATVAGPIASRGRLVVFSGIDGSGKTTVAMDLVERLQEQGIRAEYFYGHRTAYRRRGTHVSFAIAFRSFWRHSHRDLGDLRRHRRARGMFALMTLLDYRLVMRRLRKVLVPGVVVVTDRYVADVLAFLRSLGGGFEPIEGLLIKVSIDPDATIFFDIDPETALRRKSEQTLEELRRFEEAYRDLRQIILMRTVDASKPVEEVVGQVLRLLEEDIRLPHAAAQAPRPA